MNTIVKLFLAAFLTIGSLHTNAQKISVSECKNEVETVSRTGLYTEINLDKKLVEKAWEKKLKEFGKISSSKNAYILTGAEIPGVTSKPSIIYSIVEKGKNGVKVWWAIDLGSSFVTSEGSNSQYRGASQILTDFAASCYQEDINNQIEEAEKALSKSVKNHEKEVREGEGLVKDVEKNKQEKIDLEQKIVENGNDLKELNQEIEQNKNDQKAALQEIDKMKKAVEAVKGKLQQIGK